MANLALPPSEFVQGLKLGWPEATDEQAVQIFNSVLQSTPEAAKMDPMELGKTTAQIAKATVAKSKETPEVNTQLKSPMTGTQMAQRNPQNPEAEWIDQFDPQSVDKQRKAYEDLYNQNVGQRNLTSYTAALSGNQGIMEQSRKGWSDIDAHNLASTQGLLEKKQEAATKGEALATSAQSRFKQAGEYTGTQAKKQQELDLGGIDVEVKKKMNDPNSAMSRLARASAIRQWMATNDGNAPDKATLDEFNKMNFLELGPIAEPNILKMWKDISAGRTAEQGADVGEAVTGSLINKGKPKVAPSSAKFNFKPGTTLSDLQAMRQVLATSKDTPPGDLAAFDAQYPEVAKSAPATKASLTPEGANRTKYMSVNTPAGSMPPTPQTMAAAAAEGTSSAEAEKRIEQWNNYTGPKLAEARDLIKGIGSGKGTAAMAAWLPGQERELINVLQQANQSLPGVLPASIASELSASLKQGGFTGGLVASLENGQLMRAIDAFESNHNNFVKTARSRNENIDAGGPANRTSTNAPVASTKSGTIEMTKDGKTYDIPADKAEAAIGKGYRVK